MFGAVARKFEPETSNSILGKTVISSFNGSLLALRSSRVGKMKWLLEIGIFAASILAGLFLGDLVPMRSLTRSWRIAIAAVLIAIGIALTIVGFSS